MEQTPNERLQEELDHIERILLGLGCILESVDQVNREIRSWQRSLRSNESPELIRERKEALMRSLIAAGDECDSFSRLVVRMERIF